MHCATQHTFIFVVFRRRDAWKPFLWRQIARIFHPQWLEHILRGIAAIAKGRQIVIQSLFCRLGGLPTPEKEILAYCDRVGAVLKSGGGIKLIQVHTVARSPASPEVTPLGDIELDGIARHIRSLLPVPVETYYGSTGAG